MTTSLELHVCPGHRAVSTADRLPGRRAWLAHVADKPRGTVLVDAALEHVPALIRSAVAGIPRSSITDIDGSTAVITQRSGVLIPRAEVITLGFRRAEDGRAEVVILAARRGGLAAPDAVPSQFERALLASIRTASKKATH